MSKDAKGHGSNPRGAQKATSWIRGIGRPDHVADDFQREAFGKAQDKVAAERLASGPKSAPVPVHEAMTEHGVRYQPGVTGGALSLHGTYGTDWKKYDKGRGQ